MRTPIRSRKALGALADKPGLFETADGGTIFLDEIDTLAPELQTKVLHAIERALLLSSPGTFELDELDHGATPPTGRATPIPFPASLVDIQRAAALAMIDTRAAVAQKRRADLVYPALGSNGSSRAYRSRCLGRDPHVLLMLASPTPAIGCTRRGNRRRTTQEDTMTAGRICSRVVATAAPSERVRIAARRMATNDVGTLVVLDDAGRGEAVGIVTDRDIALRCVAGELNPDEAHVSEVMTHPVETIDEYASVDTALAKMASGGKRRLIVTGDDHRVVGIVSLDDVLGMLAREIRPIGRLLEQQEPRIPA